MNNAEHPITTDAARAALASLAAASNIAVNSMRPPLWLILLCAIALGILITRYGRVSNGALILCVAAVLQRGLFGCA